MQLGIRLHDTTKLPFEERIAQVHELGFACGHLALSKVIDEFSTADEALTPGLAMYIKNVFAKNQVDIAVLGCYLNLANPSQEQLAETMHHYMAHIRFASWLGCGVVGTETGAPNETYTGMPYGRGIADLYQKSPPHREICEKDGRGSGDRAGIPSHCMQSQTRQKSAG